MTQAQCHRGASSSVPFALTEKNTSCNRPGGRRLSLGEKGVGKSHVSQAEGASTAVPQRNPRRATGTAHGNAAPGQDGKAAGRRARPPRGREGAPAPRSPAGRPGRGRWAWGLPGRLPPGGTGPPGGAAAAATLGGQPPPPALRRGASQGPRSPGPPVPRAPGPAAAPRRGGPTCSARRFEPRRQRAQHRPGRAGANPGAAPGGNRLPPPFSVFFRCFFFFLRKRRPADTTIVTPDN